jgi:hypothetical protein
MYNISVVIPTLGDNSLLNTINILNSGSIVPKEILVCIPGELIEKVQDLPFKNTKIIQTDSYGQVYQRIQGFMASTCDFVLQLDDDIILDNNCLKTMADTLMNLDLKSAVCPIYFSNTLNFENILINHLFYQNLVNPTNIYRKIINKIIHGKMILKDGDITSSSVNIHFDPTNKNNNHYEVNWLPGGCVLHRRANLYLNNYFIYKGKAFCEDIIHSHLLKSNDIKLYVSRYSYCVLDFENETNNLSFKNKIKYIYDEFKSRLLFTKISNASYLRLFIFYISIYYSLPFSFIKNKFLKYFYEK